MKRTSAILMLLCCSLASTVSAQDRWLERYVEMGPNITGANRATALARLEAIERLLRQVPELAQPKGFEISHAFTGHRDRSGFGDTVQHYVIQYILRVGLFAPKWVKFRDAQGELIFAINADENARAWHDPEGRVIFVEGSRWPPSPFATVTYGDADSGGPVQPNDPFEATVWLTSGGEMPWHAVTREEFYAASIAGAEGDKGEERAKAKKAFEKTGYQRWLEEAPQRKKEREETIAAVTKVAPAEAANLRKTLEDAEREAGEKLKENEASEREQAKTFFASTDSMRAELSRMTPAQRKLPAIADDNPTESRATGVNLRDSDTLLSSVHRVLKPNYDFWRARKSPVDVRLIQAYFYVRGSPPPAVLNAMYQTYKKLDWRALAALLDQPPKE